MHCTCTECHALFEITESDRALYAKLALSTPSGEIPIPLPTLCPKHRLQRRWAFRNERNLYRTTCAVSGRSIISFLPPTTQYRIIDQALWWDTSWDGTEYGVPYDFSKPFFVQFDELMKRVPHFNLQSEFTSSENCDFTNHTSGIKDCYMIFDSCNSRDCLYGEMLSECVSCIDCTNCFYCELTAHSVDCVRCYDSMYLNQCHGCSESAFLYDCRGCHHCFFSTGFRNQSYVWRNEQLTREEYERLWRELAFSSFAFVDQLDREFEMMRMRQPRRYASLHQSEDCTGNALASSVRTYHSYDSMNLRDCSYIISGFNIRDSLDVEHAMECELCHEVISAGVQYRTSFSVMSMNSAEVCYAFNISNVKRSFGCASLKNQEFCILNKKYNADEYYALLPKIVEHMKSTHEWGEFFPIALSPFGYNDTLAQLYIPLTEQEAAARGYQWCQYKAPESTLAAQAMDDFGDVRPRDTNVLRGAVFECKNSHRRYRLTAQELVHYERLNLPLPRLHPEERYKKRIAKQNLRALFSRSCSRCNVRMVTCYPDDFAGEVLCEGCYHTLIA